MNNVVSTEVIFELWFQRWWNHSCLSTRNFLEYYTFLEKKILSRGNRDIILLSYCGKILLCKHRQITRVILYYKKECHEQLIYS